MTIPLRRYLFTDIPRTTGVLLLSGILRILGLAAPLITAYVIDRIIPAKGLLSVGPVCVVIVLLFISSAGFQYARATLQIDLQIELERKLGVRFVTHVLGLPFPYLQHTPSALLLSRFSGIQRVRDALAGHYATLALDSALAMSYGILLFRAAPLLGLLVLCLGLVMAVAAFARSRASRGATAREIDERTKEIGFLGEAFRGIATVKILGAQAEVLKRWKEFMGQRVSATKALAGRELPLAALNGAFSNTIALVLIVVGALFVVNGALTMGQMLGFNALAFAFLGPITSFTFSLQSLQAAYIELQRIEAILSEPTEPVAEDVSVTASWRGAVELNNLCFTYPGTDREVLSGVTLTIQPGELVVLTGMSGSGKSTLASLLVGLQPATSGSIQFDGMPLSTIATGSLRANVGFVSQETFLFRDTIEANVLCGSVRCDRASVANALRAARLDSEDIAVRLAADTRLAENGSDLSGGQRQRLAIARALVRRPRVVILDEATNGLDTETERQVIEGLMRMGITTIVIAHRWNSCIRPDKCFYLEDGRLSELSNSNALPYPECASALAPTSLSHGARTLVPETSSLVAGGKVP